MTSEITTDGSSINFASYLRVSLNYLKEGNGFNHTRKFLIKKSELLRNVNIQENILEALHKISSSWAILKLVFCEILTHEKIAL